MSKKANELIKKMEEENELFQKELAKEPPQVIINSAFEIIIKQDIIYSMQENELTDDLIDILLKIGHPLEYIYLEIISGNFSYMEDLNHEIEAAVKKFKEGEVTL